MSTAGTKLRYQKSYASIYRVGLTIGGEQQCLFTSIQSAINQAVADGHTSNDNPAFVEIYPGAYTENLALAPGVHLIGQGTKQFDLQSSALYEITVTGNHTYANSASANRNQGRVIIRGICLRTINGVGLVYSGTNASEIVFKESFLYKDPTGDVNFTFQFTNTNANSRVRFFDAIVSNEVATSTIMDLQRGLTQFFGNISGATSTTGVALTAIATLSNAAQLNCFSQAQMGGTPFTNMFNLTSASNIVQIDRSQIQNTLVGGVAFNFTANAVVRVRQSAVFLQDTTSKVAAGATGSILLINNSYGGTGSTPFSQVDSGVNVIMSTGKSQWDKNTLSFYVGGGQGFSTIQAAITQAQAVVGAGVRQIIIAPGDYIENLTITAATGSIQLVADTKGCESTNSKPVTIVGNHTFNPGANGTLIVNNIAFSNTAGNAKCWNYTGGAAAGSVLTFKRCSFSNSANDGNSAFVVTNTGGTNFLLKNCFINFSSDNGSCFDLSTSVGCSLQIQDHLGDISSSAQKIAPSTLVSCNGNFINGGSGTSCQFQQINMNLSCQTAFNIAFADIQIIFDRCYFENEVQQAILFNYIAAGNVHLRNCTINGGNAGDQGIPMIAIDGGTRSNSLVTLTANPTAGEKITINGLDIIFDTDVAIGATAIDTTQNLSAFINASVDVAIVNIVFSTWTPGDNFLLLQALDTGTAGDVNTVTTDSGVITLSNTPNFAGGVDGAGGGFSYGSTSFDGERLIQSSLSISASPTAPTAI